MTREAGRSIFLSVNTFLLAFTILFPFGLYECSNSIGVVACVPHDASLPVAHCRRTGNTGNKYPTTYDVGICMIGDREFTVYCPSIGYPEEGGDCTMDPDGVNA